MVNKGTDETVKKALTGAHSQVLFLADMINDLAMLSRAERGTLTVEPETIVPTDLISELVESYKQQAANKGLELRSFVAPHTPELHSSRLYVHEVLQNFVTNAIKYTESGSVTVTAKGMDDGIEFAVVDTGIGISKNDQKRVFDKFFRSEDYRTRATNGTGLGLYVTAKLVKLLNANLELTSELNHGSTFTIKVPNAPQPPTE